jgi:hypothetical protein
MAEKIKVRWDVEEEDIPVKGNVMASGNDEDDHRAEQEVLSQLRSGNIYAWCVMIVTATYKGFTGKAALGGCSYKSKEDLLQDQFEAMKKDAIHNLKTSIEATVLAGKEARKALKTIDKAEVVPEEEKP